MLSSMLCRFKADIIVNNPGHGSLSFRHGQMLLKEERKLLGSPNKAEVLLSFRECVKPFSNV